MTTEHDIKQLAERLAKEWPKAHTSIGLSLDSHSTGRRTVEYYAYCCPSDPFASRQDHRIHSPIFSTLPELTAWLEAHWLKEEGK